MVHAYVPEIIKIINTMPPGAVCATVGLCSAAGVQTGTQGRTSFQQTATYRRLLETYAPDRAAQTGGAEQEGGGVPSNDACQMCQFVVQYAKVWVRGSGRKTLCLEADGLGRHGAGGGRAWERRCPWSVCAEQFHRTIAKSRPRSPMYPPPPLLPRDPGGTCQERDRRRDRGGPRHRLRDHVHGRRRGVE